jgi:hypothetical protein
MDFSIWAALATAAGYLLKAALVLLCRLVCVQLKGGILLSLLLFVYSAACLLQ